MYVGRSRRERCGRWVGCSRRDACSGVYVGHAPGFAQWDVRGARAGMRAVGCTWGTRRDACRGMYVGHAPGCAQWDVRGVRAGMRAAGCTWGTRRDACRGMYVGYAPGCAQREVRGARAGMRAVGCTWGTRAGMRAVGCTWGTRRDARSGMYVGHAPGFAPWDVRGVRAPGACRVRASAHRLRSDAPLSGLELPRSLRGVARGPRARSRPHEHVGAPALTACAPASAQRLHAPPDLRYATASRWLCVGCGLSPCHTVPVGATLRNSMEVFAR